MRFSFARKRFRDLTEQEVLALAISSEEEWKKLVDRTLNNGRIFSERISAIDPKTLWSDFTDPKYGNYFRNILGVIEHTHYHLGQIVMVKKIIEVDKNKRIACHQWT